MADGIDAPVKAVKAADANAVGHGLAAQPGLQELPTRHHTVLALGKPTDQDIGTLVTFDVHRTFKVISVGHADQDACPYCPRGARSVTTPAPKARESVRAGRAANGPWREGAGAGGQPSFGLCHGSASLAARRSARPSAGTRACSRLSRSRSVTVPSSIVWPSTVIPQGVPISSWRR